MEAIPSDQLERIQPIVQSVRDSIRHLSRLLPDDAPSAVDYSPPE